MISLISPLPQMRCTLLLLVCLAVLGLLLPVCEAGSARAGRRAGRTGQGRGRTLGHRGRKAGRRGRQEYEEEDENAVDAGEEEGSGSDIANGCDHLTEIGAFMNHAKELAWCLENDPELELGLYAPLVALAEARALEGFADGEEEVAELEAAEEVVEAARRARARRGRSQGKGGKKGKKGARKGERRAGKGRRGRKASRRGKAVKRAMVVARRG